MNDHGRLLVRSLSLVLIVTSIGSAPALHGQQRGSQSESVEISNPGVRKSLQGGRYWLARESYSRAAQYYERCHQLAEGRSLECLVGLAKAHNALEQYDLAVSYARLATALGGGNELLAQAFNQLGLALFRPLQARWEQERDPRVRHAVLDRAESAFRSAHGLLPDDPWVVLNLTTVLAARWMMAEEQVHHAELEGLLKRVLQDSPGEENESWARSLLSDMGVESEGEYGRDGAESEGRRFDCGQLRAAIAHGQEPWSDPNDEELNAGDEDLRDVRPVRGDVFKPERVYDPQPQYTESTRKARVQGVVIVQAVIDTTGRVPYIEVLQSLHEELDREAAKAICTWRFRPATLAGKPVSVYFNQTVNFRLQ